MKSKALYVHIPFCRSICAYCDFCRVVYQKKLVRPYLEALNNELKRLEGQTFETVYIGGGTPTSFDEEELKELLEMLSPYLKSAREKTMEANPETLNDAKAALLENYGINRVSLGIQSFEKRLLDLCGRRHTREDVEYALQLLRTHGITNISADFIYGLPTQRKEEFLSDLKTAVGLQIPHLSFYMLTIEENSVFGKKGVKPQEEELSDSMYFEGIAYLNRKGYHQYEISNFCLNGYESEHNKVYWRYENYEGVGMGASGKVDHVRYTNTSSFEKYFRGEYREEELHLSESDLAFETVMMGLRLKEGITLSDENYQRYQNVIYELEQKNLLVSNGQHIRCSEKGYYLLNDVLLEFMED